MKFESMETILLEKSINNKTVQLIRYLMDKDRDYTVRTLKADTGEIIFQEKYILSYQEACEEYQTQYKNIKERVHGKEKSKC